MLKNKVIAIATIGTLLFGGAGLCFGQLSETEVIENSVESPLSIEVEILDGIVDFGSPELGAEISTVDVGETQTIANNSGFKIDLAWASTNAENINADTWALVDPASVNSNNFALESIINSNAPNFILDYSIATLDPAFAYFGYISSGQTANFDYLLSMPLTTSYLATFDWTVSVLITKS